MSNADNSYEGRTQRLRSRTLAAFRANNPTAPEAGRYIFDESTRVVRRMGQMRVTVQPAEGETYTIPCCSCDAPTISGFTPGDFIPTEPNFTFNVTWNPVPGTTASFNVTPGGCGDTITSQSYTITGPGSANVVADVGSASCDVTITMTLTSSCGSATASGPAGVCFLAGACVTLADGTEKLIEDVLVGDSVLGAFGETNTVLALHRPLLGENRMCSINGDHHTSNHHPHIGAGKQFYSNDIAWLQKATYGQEHNVINAVGEVESRMLHGLRSDRMIPMAVGVELKTVTGSRPVESLDVYNMAPETQLYNLVIGGSHTYFVDGYAVTGWPREDDFDYDAWAPRI
jgi:hypothetical protein